MLTYIPVSFLCSFIFRVRVKIGLGLVWVLGLGFGFGIGNLIGGAASTVDACKIIVAYSLMAIPDTAVLREPKYIAYYAYDVIEMCAPAAPPIRLRIRTRSLNPNPKP